MIVPWQDIAADTLDNLLEEYVSRDGTDYGEQEVPMATRVMQMRNLLRRGDVVIWYDEPTETISLFPKDQIPLG